MLKEAKFVPTPYEWHNTGSDYQAMLAWIPPEDFMRLAMSEFGHIAYDIEEFVLDTQYQRQLRAAMLAGRPITTPFLSLRNPLILDVSQGGYVRIINANPDVRIEGHEGRNRARIAYDLGVRIIPCKFWLIGMKNWREYDKIWEKPNVEQNLLHYLGIRGKTVRA